MSSEVKSELIETQQLVDGEEIINALADLGEDIETSLDDADDVPEGNEEEESDEVSSGVDGGGECEECGHSTQLIDFIRQEFGEDLSQYKDDYELLRGLLNAKKAVGRKDDDARVAKMLRDMYGDEFVNALISGQIPIGQAQQHMQQAQQAAKEQVKVEDEHPLYSEAEFDEKWLTMVTRDEDGNLIPAPGAPKDIVDKILNFARTREGRINEFVKNPRRFIREAIGREIIAEAIAAVRSHLSEAIGQTADQLKFQEFAQKHKEMLFVGGDPTADLTEFGEEVLDKASQLMKEGITSEARAIELAFNWAQEKRAVRPNRTRPPTPQGFHSSARNKTRETKPVTLEDLIDQGFGLADAYRKLKELS